MLIGVGAYSRMRCPKCQFDHPPQTTECLKCGIVFARYEAAMAAGHAGVHSGPDSVELGPGSRVTPPQSHGQARPEQSEGDAHATSANLPPLRSRMPAADFDSVDRATLEAARNDAKRELKFRVFAFPLALLGARLLVSTGLRTAVRMLSMVLHECGHALSAWLTGRWAVPLLWVTLHGEERSYLIGVALAAGIIVAGFLAWKAKRWGWMIAAGALLVLQLRCLMMWPYNAEALIVFGGDGGALVLATLLMALFYVGRQTALYKTWGLRWGLLVIGALSFMDVFRTWSGPLEDLPFGEEEGVGASDPTQLTETYGWSVLTMVDRYNLLAHACLIVLALFYLWGLVSAYLEARSPSNAGRDPAAA